MEIITLIFNAIGQALTAFASQLANAVTSVTAMFYTPGSGSDPGQLTFLGVLLCIAGGVGLVYFAYKTIRGLIRYRG